jgi:hypothetical protein
VFVAEDGFVAIDLDYVGFIGAKSLGGCPGAAKVGDPSVGDWGCIGGCHFVSPSFCA